MTKRFEKNKNGKVEFTATELKALLDEVYNEGYNNGKYCSGVVWNPPYRYDDWWNKPYITWCSDSNSITTGATSNVADQCTATSTTTIDASNYSNITSASLLNTDYHKE